MYARDHSFLYEPDPTTNLLKSCPVGGGSVKTIPSTKVLEALAGLSCGLMQVDSERKMRELFDRVNYILRIGHC
jgi:sarcosine oxidase/L-pipecolate oxidase